MAEWKAAGKRLKFTVQLCFDCGACVRACPHDFLVLMPNRIEINHFTCTLCKACVRTCPTGAQGI